MTTVPADLARRAMARAEAAVARGDSKEAAEAFLVAIESAPGHAPAWSGLGLARMRAGDARGAAEAFERAVAIAPSASAAYNLGTARSVDGDLARAEAAYREAIGIDPAHARAHNNLGDLLRRRGDFAAAILSFQEAIRLDPDYALARHGLGHSLLRLRHVGAAATVLADLVRRRPDDAQAAHSLALALGELGETEAARAAFDHAIARRDAPAWRVQRALLLPVILDSIAARDAARRTYADGIASLAADEAPLPADALPGPPFRLCYQGLDDRPLQEALVRALRGRFPVLDYRAPHLDGPRPPGRFRIAIVSATLRVHTVGRLMGALIDQMHGPEIEVILFQSGRADDHSAGIAATADRAIRLSGPLADRQRLVAASTPDLLLYPEIGMDQATWHLAFARLAPVQAVMWGHPVTTGIDTIDHYLSARDHEPDDANDHYSERLVRLDAMPMVFSRPPPAAPLDRAGLGLPADAPLLACPQSPFKIHPDADDLFAAVLRAAPQALLVIPHWVEPYWVDRLRRRFATRHRDVADRLVHPRRLAHDEYLGLVAESVALLDPPHFTGGQTTLEAFSLGTPVVTLPGRFLRGRLTAGFYRQLGIDAAIAADPTDYARIAARLVHDRPWRTALSEHLRSETEKRLIDDLAGARALRSYVRGLAGLD